jgi:hypothetical protein
MTADRYNRLTVLTGRRLGSALLRVNEFQKQANLQIPKTSIDTQPIVCQQWLACFSPTTLYANEIAKYSFLAALNPFQ